MSMDVEPAAMPESENVIASPITVTYFTIRAGQLVAGLLLLVVGIAGFFNNKGLIMFLFPMPPIVSISVVPLIAALVFILRSVLMMEKVTIIADTSTLVVKAKRLWINKERIPWADIRYIGINYVESKVTRWGLVFILLVLSSEVYLKVGLELFGLTGIGAFLIFCFVFTVTGVAIFILSPRRFIEIGTNKQSIFVPLPRLGNHDTREHDLLKILGLDEMAGQPVSLISSFKVVARHNLFPALFGAFLVGTGIMLMANPALYFGQFTIPMTITLGAKLLVRAFQGNGKFMRTGDASCFSGCSPSLTLKKLYGARIEEQQENTAKRTHPLEIIAYFYLVLQSIRYGFRFAWWSYAGFNIGIFFLAVTLLVFIFLYWFGPATRIVADLGDCSISFILSTAQELGGSFVARLKTRIQHAINAFRKALGLLPRRMDLAWIWILFVAFVIVSVFVCVLWQSNIIF